MCVWLRKMCDPHLCCFIPKFAMTCSAWVTGGPLRALICGVMRANECSPLLNGMRCADVDAP